MAETLWSLQSVRLGSKGAARLEVAALSISPGVTAVLGASGAGKSSLLNLLVGYEKPSVGSVDFELGGQGESLDLFWVPPSDGLWPGMTVGEHVGSVASDESCVEELLEEFELGHLVHRVTDDLSRGERARVSVARALASGARVLVMDEPLGHVNAPQEAKGWRAIEAYLKRTGASLVFATHRPEVVLRYADRAICLEEGGVIYDGAVGDLYACPPSEKVGRCLGAVNWFEADAAERWLGGDCVGGVRPENLRIEADADLTGELVLEGVTRVGLVVEVDVKHESTSEVKRFSCVEAKVGGGKSNPLEVGARVALRLCMLMLICVLSFGQLGCDSKESPDLPVVVGDYWSMPSVGPMMPAPRGVAIGEDNQIIVLDNAGRVIIFDTQGEILKQWFMPAYDVGKPEGVCLLRDGRYVVADTHYHRLVFFDREGNVDELRGSEGTGPGQFIYPVHVTEDVDGNLYVAEYGSNDRIQKFNADGEFLVAFGGFGGNEGEFQRLSGIAWHDGKVYAADAVNHRIQVFTDDGKFVTVLKDAGQPINLRFPYDISVGSDNNLYVVEYGAGRLTVIGLDGSVVGRWGFTSRGANGLITPWGLAVDDRNRVWIADTGNRRIVKLERE